MSSRELTCPTSRYSGEPSTSITSTTHTSAPLVTLAVTTTKPAPTRSSTSSGGVRTHHGKPWALLQYLVDPHDAQGPSSGVIIGSVVTGVVAFILLVIAGTLCFLRRRRRRMWPVRIKARYEDQVLTPFVLPPKPNYTDMPIASHYVKYSSTRPPPAASVPESVTTTTSLWEADVSSSEPNLPKKNVSSSSRGTAPKRVTRKPSRWRLRGEQSFLDMESVTSAPSSTARSSVKYSSSPVSTGDAEMRRQFQLLEKELGRRLDSEGRLGSDAGS